MARARPIRSIRRPLPRVAVSILAGGLSSRLGRDKSGARLGRRTLLGHVRAVARTLGFPVRIIRQDLVPRCGPLGGIYSALKTSHADAELFLACDMPFVSAELLDQVLWPDDDWRRATFVAHDGRVGFPFLLPVPALAAVGEQIRRRRFSLHGLAGRLRARLVSVPLECGRELFNVNTLEDWRLAHAFLMGRNTAGATKACDGRDATAKNPA